MIEKALVGGRPGVPVEMVTRTHQARDHGGLDLEVDNWFKINWRLEPMDLLMDRVWDRGEGNQA